LRKRTSTGETPVENPAFKETTYTTE